MAWFGWKPGREESRPVLSRVLGGGVRAGVVEWPASYEAQVRAGYCRNAVAQRAVKLVAESVGGAPLNVGDDGLRALVARRGLLETVAAQLLLHGNAFIQIGRGEDGRPAVLFALRPERVMVEPDARGWPAAYRYTVAERVTRLPAESVIHVRAFNPVDDHYGLGCLGAASGAIAIHNAAAAWNKALLDNAARPSGALGEPGVRCAATGGLRLGHRGRHRVERDRGRGGGGAARLSARAAGVFRRLRAQAGGARAVAGDRRRRGCGA